MGVFNKTRRVGALSQQAGFTLIEVMVAVSIVAIMAAVAIPNFTRMYKDYQAKMTASEIARFLVLVRTRAMTTNQTLAVQIVLVNGSVSMTTLNLAGAQALPVNTLGAVQITTFAFNNGAIPNGGLVQFDSYGFRTSVPGTGVQTILMGGTDGGAPTTQYQINIAPSGTSRLVRL
jgi:prepilin-type N-terminal cleavage/methylation domain-containing protein